MDSIGFIVILGICIALFFVLKELMCWYWKINERIELQKKTNEILGKILLELIANDKVADNDNKEAKGNI